jgi:hypothetical protein
LDAVNGVLGVLAFILRGGGVVLPSEVEESLSKAAIFEVVGVLKGKRFKGGSLSGCRVFLA